MSDCTHENVRDGVCVDCGATVTRAATEDKSWPPRGMETK